MKKTLSIRTRTGILSQPVYNTIYVGDTSAYELKIELANLTTIPGTVILRFVRSDNVTIETIVPAESISGNVITHVLTEQQTAVAGELKMYIRIVEGTTELYTTTLITFPAVTALAGGNVVPTEADQNIVAQIAGAEALRVTAETARSAAETLRATSENARLSAENDRQQAEIDRATAENARGYWAAFDPTRQYSVGEKAYYLGSSYICESVPAIGVLPTNSSCWSIIVQKGDVQFATFDANTNGELIMTTTLDYSGPTFSLTEAGNLEVSI